MKRLLLLLLTALALPAAVNADFLKKEDFKQEDFKQLEAAANAIVFRSVINNAQKKLNENDFNEAMKYCEKAIDLQPENYESFTCRAFALWGLNQKRKALNDFNQSLKLEPNPPMMSSYFYRGALQFNMRRRDKSTIDRNACSDIRKAFKASYPSAIEYVSQNKSFLKRDKCTGFY